MSILGNILDRLVAAEVEKAELQTELEQTREERDQMRAELESRHVARQIVFDKQAELDAALLLIERLKPQKQFRIILRRQQPPALSNPLEILSVASSNGLTTITVELSDDDFRSDG